MNKQYYICNECGNRSVSDICVGCGSGNVTLYIKNGTRNIPVKYVEEKKKIERPNIFDRLQEIINDVKRGV